MLSKISHREIQILYALTYKWNLDKKKKTTELKHIENRLLFVRSGCVEVVGRRVHEMGEGSKRSNLSIIKQQSPGEVIGVCYIKIFT